MCSATRDCPMPHRSSMCTEPFKKEGEERSGLRFVNTHTAPSIRARKSLRDHVANAAKVAHASTGKIHQHFFHLHHVLALQNF